MLTRLASIMIAIAIFWGCSKSNSIQTTPTPPQNPTPPAYDGKIISNVVYGSNKDWLGQTQSLAMDIYLPTQEVSTSNKYPVVVSIHGGAFDFGDKSDIVSDCEILASKGFIVAAINYRVGWDWIKKSDPEKCTADTSTLTEAWYRAQQDTRASIRFLVANATKYGIDPNWIFIEGSSAGAEAALGVPYFPQDSADVYMPGIKDTLGTLDNATNSLTNTYKIQGLGSMWGALNSPYLITSENATPTIFFAGVLGVGVPWDVDHYWGCSNFAIGYGAKPLYNRTASFGVPAVAHIDPNGYHEVYTVEFREDNIACFFNGLMTKQPQNGWDYSSAGVSNCP